MCIKIFRKENPTEKGNLLKNGKIPQLILKSKYINANKYH